VTTAGRKTDNKCEKGKDPKTCSPQQIRECHGDTVKHPCVGKART
jgi:hypothetical protein